MPHEPLRNPLPARSPARSPAQADWDAAMIAAPKLVPGGHGSDPALDVAGVRLTYADFAGLVADTARALADAGDPERPTPVDATGLSVIRTLATVFAAAEIGRPVLVGDPSASRAPAGDPAGRGLPPDAFLLAVTSGSTGRPRTIMRTAASWTRSFEPFAALTGLSAADTVLLTGALQATMHLFAAVHALALGAQVTDRREIATAAHAVPAVLGDLLDTRPPGLRRVVVGGAALPPRWERAALRAGVAVTEYYGSAELSFVAARRCPGPLTEFPGVEVRISADGELWARSDYLALGYLEGGAAPGSAPLRRDPDDFATVGDRAVRDGTGLRILGRGEAALQVGGATVLAEDVEAALLSIPGVRDAAVVGTPHRRLGELPTAVLVLDPGTDLADVRRQARCRLRGAALPRRWLTAGRLPRTGGGKLARAGVAAAVRDRTRPGTSTDPFAAADV